MSLTFDERIELADRNASVLKRQEQKRKSQIATWLIFAHYLGFRDEPFLISMGTTLKVAATHAYGHRAYLEAEGPVPDVDADGNHLWPQIPRKVGNEFIVWRKCPYRGWIQVKDLG